MAARRTKDFRFSPGENLIKLLPGYLGISCIVYGLMGGMNSAGLLMAIINAQKIVGRTWHHLAA
jgi:hypothetical protein